MTGQSQPAGHLAAAGQPAAGFREAGGHDAVGTGFPDDLVGLLVEHAGIRPGDLVLDAGCGEGAATILAARAAGPGGRVTGIDASPVMLERAAAAARGQRLGNVSLLCANVLAPPLPSGSADVVISSGALQFLDMPRRAARKWLGLLAPGGRLAVSWGMGQDPAWVPVMAVLDAVVPAPHPGIEAFLRRPPFDSARALEQMLAAAGYAGPVTIPQSLTTVYDSPDQWWQAVLGQAPWGVSWRHISSDALEEARAWALAMVEELRGSDGKIRQTLLLGCTLAVKPPDPR